MPSRLLADLHPDIAPLVRWFLDDCKKNGLDILVTCTWRSGAEQKELYAKGRDAFGNIIDRNKVVTYAKAGKSKHNFMIGDIPASKAVDIVPRRGKELIWDKNDPSWKQVGEIGENCGLEWGGRWKRQDYPHFQLREK
jgi:peptidoglycan L-alanyl-D-glutamate endopeptidase CwlK